MTPRSVLAVLPLILLLAACSPTVKTAEPGTLYVDPTIELGSISPYLYGTNYGPAHAVPMDMVPFVMDAGITALRFPGGAWGDNIDLPHIQIDQFVAFYTQMGALPTISVRLLGGTPEKAAELVRYTNKEMKYGVVYWSIGNEPNLYASQKHISYDTVRFNSEWRDIAKAMKAVDPTIKLMGPELSQWNIDYPSTPKDSAGRDWMTEFLQTNGDLVDVITVHRYPMYSPNGPVTVQNLRDNTHRWTGEVEYLKNLVNEVTKRDLPIAITELNSDPSSIMLQIASPDSFYNAIWYSDVLGQLAQQKVFMVNQWVLSQRGNGLGLIKGNEIRPTLYTFYMYKYFGSELVQASSGVTDINVYAAKREDGALTIMVINLSDTGHRIPLRVKGLTLTDADVWLLDATHNAESLGLQTFAPDGSIDLPSQSVTLFVIKSIER